jgi:hypothetical protein
LFKPFFFLGALWAAAAFWKRRGQNPLPLYLFCMGLPVFLGHWLFTFYARVLPNWIAVSVPPMFCLMVAYGAQFRRTARVFLTGGLGLGLLAFVLLHDTDLIGRLHTLLPAEADESHRLRGWAETAALVEGEREKLAATDGPAFIIAGHYGLTGTMSFYSPAARAALGGEPLVYCVTSETPANQFYYWPQYDYRRTRRGQNAIYASLVNGSPYENGWIWHWLKNKPVATRPAPAEPIPPVMAAQFESVTDLGVREVTLDHRVFHRVHLWACHRLR